MTSKEALKYLLADSELLYCEHEEDIKFYLEAEKEYNIVLKDLDRLEKLEKENQELKEKVKMLKELNDINKKFADLATKAIQENNKLKKVIEILKDKLEITLYSHDEYFNPPMINGTEIFKNLTQEEYELLKEVLEND